ncbi:hypothetical protein BZA77DRAFT_307753 [Pyronema omphalodes]|nr:hypothetical protein BZA77DRAFT_307753 [Pyronema omphalodes]
MVSSSVHHHRSTTKSTNKAFKSRKSTKSELRAKHKGKVDDATSISRKGPHQQVMSKIERRNKARQLQQNKTRDAERESRIFKGKDAAPRIVAVVPLSDDVSGQATVQALLKSLDMQVEVPEVGQCITWIERFKQKIQWIILGRDMLPLLDACKAADFVLLTLSAQTEVDSYGHNIIRSIESQGISNTYAVVQHLETVEPAKRRPDVKKSLLSFISHFFPTTTKIYENDSTQEAPNLIRSICTSSPKGIHWRDDRSYMLVEEARQEGDFTVLSGVVRGRGLNPDRLVHIQNFGDFQIEKICAYPSENHRHQTSNDDMMMDDATPAELQVLALPTQDQDDLLEMAPEGENVMEDVDDNVSMAGTTMSESRKGVLLDDHHYFEDEYVKEAYVVPKQLPSGTSEYQAAWFIEGEDYGSDSENGSEQDDEDMDMEEEPEARPEDGLEGLEGPVAPTVAGTVYGDDAKSEFFADLSPDDQNEAEAIAQFRRSRLTESEEDREFPDEIELEPGVLVRERLARYRGLKSLRSSKWETEEDKPYEPEDWNRLARIQDYRTTKNRMIAEALAGGVQPGTKVIVYLRAGNPEIVDAFVPGRPMTMFSLLRHEHKQSVVNVSLTASTDYTGEVVKAKEELIFQIGSRRLHVNPLFSEAGGRGSNNVAKFHRFLLPGSTSIATFVAPITWGSVPVVVWKRADEQRDWELVAQGSFEGVDSTRVVAKRVVLTGHPYKIHKRLVTVRYMFFNREDVEWFKALPLYTKRGRSGYIKEALGTHGYFKATFDGRINPQDAVAVSLYKRVFPRGTTEFTE